LRKIESPLTWVYCFLAYIAVLSPDPLTRNLLSYARLIICEAQRHSGPGWLEYDEVFRQQAAVNPSLPWNEINSSLHATTILSYRSGPGRFCSLCHESDHLMSQCALAHLQPFPPPAHQRLLSPSSTSPQNRRAVRPETLECICSSWNKGRCVFPGTCRFRHICATCKSRGHKARDCEETPPESLYKSGPLQSGSNGPSTTPAREA